MVDFVLINMKRYPKRVQYHHRKYIDFERNGCRWDGKPYVWNFAHISEGIQDSKDEIFDPKMELFI